MLNKQSIAMIVMMLLGMRAHPAEYDTSYSPLANGSADQGLEFWQTTGAQSVHTRPGRYCFRLTATSDTPATMRSVRMAIRPGESLQLNYDLKTVSEIARAYVAIRSYARDKSTLLDETRFGWTPSEDWTHHTQAVRAHAAAFYVDVQLVVPTGTAWLDEVTLYREISYGPLYGPIKPLSAGDTLYVFRKQRFSRAGQNIAIGTLQGTLARLDRPWIWIDAGDDTYVELFRDKYGIQFNRDHQSDWTAILEWTRDKTSGRYVLYDMTDTPSISAATTMAGLIDGVAIDVALEQSAQAKGYTRALDVRGKDCLWVYQIPGIRVLRAP